MIRWTGVTRWVIAMVAGAALARALTIASGPPIRLRPHRVRVDSPAERVLADLQAGMDSAANVVLRSEDGIVARFGGRAGGFSYRTLELVRFTDRKVSFEHLQGPFKSCMETFDVVELENGHQLLEHRGHFVMRGGIAGWVFGRLMVRRLFEGVVASHMRALGGDRTREGNRAGGLQPHHPTGSRRVPRC